MRENPFIDRKKGGVKIFNNREKTSISKKESLLVRGRMQNTKEQGEKEDNKCMIKIV